VIAEGNETPGGESAAGGESRGRRSEGDLLAERRARRSAESGEHALTLRAEAAEATVRTLETHVASLQDRLRDAEEEARRVAELLDVAQTARAAERPEGAARQAQSPAVTLAFERELQRAAQREYAEQRLRIEAEERAAEHEREARAELDRLSRRLSAGERDVEALAARLETAERELAEADQAAAAERASATRAERALRARVGQLERRAEELEGVLAEERAARGRAERALEQLNSAQRSAQALFGGLAETVARLREAAARPVAAAQTPVVEPAPPAPDAPRAPAPPPDLRPPRERATEAHDGEMAAALAAAVERLRARVEEQSPQAVAAFAQPPSKLQSHKHAMSLIGRARLRLRMRRERRKQRI
jgi:chromosome segregation ATPase